MVHEAPFKIALKGLVVPNWQLKETTYLVWSGQVQGTLNISSAIFGIYLGSFLFHLFFISDSHLYFPHCFIPTSAFPLILFTYSLICWDCSSYLPWHSYPFSLHFHFLPTLGTWSSKYTPVPMKLNFRASLFLELQAQIFKCLPLYSPTCRSSTSPQNHLNLIIYSPF